MCMFAMELYYIPAYLRLPTLTYVALLNAARREYDDVFITQPADG